MITKSLSQKLFYLVLIALIGSPAAKAEEKAEILFIQMAEAMVVEDGKLTLSEVSSHVVWFAERPSRKTGNMTLEAFLSSWKNGSGNFQEDPPNAVLTLLNAAENPAVVELRNPVSTATGLRYDIILLEGSLPTSGGPVSLVIDGRIIGINL